MEPAIVPYAPIAASLIRPMKDIFKRHDAGEVGDVLKQDILRVVSDYEKAIASGWVDWEGDIGRYIPMLRRWSQA